MTEIPRTPSVDNEGYGLYKLEPGRTRKEDEVHISYDPPFRAWPMPVNHESHEAERARGERVIPEEFPHLIEKWQSQQANDQLPSQQP